MSTKTTFGRLFLIAAVAVLGQSTPGRAQVRPVCAPMPAANNPVLPFQFTVSVTEAMLSRGDDLRTRATDEGLAVLLTVPRDRYVEVESVAIKGSHPQGSYMAMELRTAIPGVPVPETWARSGSARHFLYAADAALESRSVHIREALHAVGGPGSQVTLGVQTGKGAKLEPFAVTLTGTLRDACTWGQR
jgi:hypothetical protein